MRFSNFLFFLSLLAFAGCADEQFAPVVTDAALEEALTTVDRAETEALAELREHEAAFAGKNHRITIPAGSTNALAAAIAGAARNAVIRLEAGDHFQSGTLTISKPVNILGDKGARLIVSGVGPYPIDAPAVRGALHVLNTEFVRIRNLEIIPEGDAGGTAILAENAPYTFVQGVTARNWQFGVVAEQSRKLYVDRSVIEGSSLWQTIPGFPVHGIVVANGKEAQIHRNEISNTVFGVWACDARGRLGNNRLSGNFNGIELCKVPTSVPLESGVVVGSELPATRWLVYNNTATGNINNGFEIIDGANNSLIVGNNSSGNGGLDYEFAGPTGRYGFPAPTSSGNFARLKPGSSWADCGENNRVRGGDLVETWECF